MSWVPRDWKNDILNKHEKFFCQQIFSRWFLQFIYAFNLRAFCRDFDANSIITGLTVLWFRIDFFNECVMRYLKNYVTFLSESLFYSKPLPTQLNATVIHSDKCRKLTILFTSLFNYHQQTNSSKQKTLVSFSVY